MFNFAMLPSDVLENIYMFASTSKDHLGRCVLPNIRFVSSEFYRRAPCYITGISKQYHCTTCKNARIMKIRPIRKVERFCIRVNRHAYNLVHGLKDHEKIAVALDRDISRERLMYELCRGPMYWTEYEMRSNVLLQRWNRGEAIIRY